MGIWDQVREKVRQQVQEAVKVEYRRFIDKFGLVDEGQLNWSKSLKRPYVSIRATVGMDTEVEINGEKATIWRDVVVVNELGAAEMEMKILDEYDEDVFSDYDRLVADVVAEFFGGKVKCARGRPLTRPHTSLLLVVDCNNGDIVVVAEAEDDC